MNRHAEAIAFNMVLADWHAAAGAKLRLERSGRERENEFDAAVDAEHDAAVVVMNTPATSARQVMAKMAVVENFMELRGRTDEIAAIVQMKTESLVDELLVIGDDDATLRGAMIALRADVRALLGGLS